MSLATFRVMGLRRLGGMTLPGKGCLPRERIVDHVADLGEDPLPHERGRHRQHGRPALVQPQPLVIAEEERLVRRDRAAEGRPELVGLVGRLDGSKDAPGVQGVFAGVGCWSGP
jgi:hypothetical protein